MNKIDITGLRYTYLVVLREVEQIGSKRRYLCQCDCGKIIETNMDRLRMGETKSCGCYSKNRIKEMSTTHNLTQTPEYVAWTSMKTRCTNKNAEKYPNYGGRGVTVCPRWINSFENFYADMGNRPSNKHSLDRFPDKNGNYGPENCRWATSEQQGRNKRNNIIVQANGRDIVLSELSEITGINYHTLYSKKGNVKQLLLDNEEMKNEIEAKLKAPKE